MSIETVMKMVVGDAKPAEQSTASLTCNDTGLVDGNFDGRSRILGFVLNGN